MTGDRTPRHRVQDTATPPEAVETLTAEATELLPKYPTTAPLVADLPIQPLLAYLDGGDNSPLPAPAMIRVFLLKEIRGIPEKAELVVYLEENPRIARLLGFERETLPSRIQCSRWWNHYFSPTLCAIITESAAEIRDQAYETGNPLDAHALEPDDKPNASPRTKDRVKDEKTEDIAEEMRKRFYPLLFLKRKGWCKYDEADFFDLLIEMGKEQAFAEGRSNNLAKEERKRGNADEDVETWVPDADTLLHHIKKFSIQELAALNDELTTVLFEMAEEMGLFEGQVDLAIDDSPWRFYGDTDTEGVSHVKQSRGTAYAYQLVTICIVGDDGERFTLDWMIVEGREEKRAAIGELVEAAQEWCDIRKIALDRGYHGVLMIQELKATGENFLVRVPKSKKRTRLLNENEGEIVVEEDDRMERSRAPYVSTETDRFIIPARESAKDDYIEFVTNMEVTEDSAMELGREYEKRWGIETSYRKIKQFLPKTSSKHYSVRIFYLMFSILLYNTWILVNAVVRESIGWPRDGSPPVTRGSFVTVLFGLREAIT